MSPNEIAYKIDELIRLARKSESIDTADNWGRMKQITMNERIEQKRSELLEELADANTG